jgi:hypothetical protein
MDEIELIRDLPPTGSRDDSDARSRARHALLEKATPSRRPRGTLFALATVTAVAAAAIVLLVGGRGTGSPTPAYGAELIRFAESTPLLLLEGPGWRVQNVSEAARGPYQPASSRGAGSMEFVTGRPIPYDHITVTANVTESGMAPPSVRQRKVELSWRHGKLEFPGLVVQSIELPVLGTTAQVNTRAEKIYIYTRTGKRVIYQGGPGDRTMAATWREDGYVLELRAAVPNLAAFEERLEWLSRVDSQTWLEAMPSKVVKAADHDAAVREMLKGIPLPGGFNSSLIPGNGLTTNRSQVGAAVTNTVSCLWFRQWGEARRTGNHAKELEAERAMATAKHWPILDQMAKEGEHPLIWELAADMPSGEGRRGWRLLPQTEALGCAREGIPVLPWKQRLQRERAQASIGRPAR